MAEALLTVSVAAYNVAAFLRQTLDSCLVASRENLEVLIIDDGSTDDTASIAREYEAAHPGLFRLISQPNSGYGSTVNRSITEAKGTYFKLLDGDDWFDADGLESLLGVLAATDTGLVLTPYVRREEGWPARIIDQAEGIGEGEYAFDECPIPWRISMHAMAYRTELLRESELKLAKHAVYTDTDYITEPLHLVEKAYISHTPAYQYRVGREGASMEAQGRIRHRGDMLALIERMLARYNAEDTSTAGRIRRAWLIDDIVGHWQILYLLPPTQESWKEIRVFRELVRSYPAVHSAVIAHSQWAQIFTHTGRATYPLIAASYRGFAAGKRLKRKWR